MAGEKVNKKSGAAPDTSVLCAPLSHWYGIFVSFSDAPPEIAKVFCFEKEAKVGGQ